MTSKEEIVAERLTRLDADLVAQADEAGELAAEWDYKAGDSLKKRGVTVTERLTAKELTHLCDHSDNEVKKLYNAYFSLVRDLDDLHARHVHLLEMKNASKIKTKMTRYCVTAEVTIPLAA